MGGSDGSVWEVAVGIKRNDANIEEREWLQVEAERSYDVELTGKYTGKWVQRVGMVSVWEVAVGIKRNDAQIEEREWLQVEAERSYEV